MQNRQQESKLEGIAVRYGFNTTKEEFDRWLKTT